MWGMRVAAPLLAGLLVGLAALPGSAAGAQKPTFAPPTDDLVGGELLVDVKDDADEATVAALARDAGVALLSNSKWSDAHDKIFRVVGASAAARAQLAADPRVEIVEPMHRRFVSFVPNDPLYKQQWHLPRVGSEQAWDYGCGRGVTVAVIDTGVACYDKGPFSVGSDLSGSRCVAGYDFVNDRPEAADDHGHGTHVAGTIGQTTHNGKGVAGLAHCARLMPIKVLSGDGWGSDADVASGIRFAADEGAQVINLSLGGPSPSKVLAAAVRYALAKGVVIVAAAGNSHFDVGYPAAFPGVLAVSASDAHDEIAWFSSRGPEVGIAAPGVDITQQTVCNGGTDKCELFGEWSGTSMASPHVAGAAALLVAQGVTEPTAVRAALRGAADPKGQPELYGAGILAAGRAVAHNHWLQVALRAVFAVVFGALLARRVRSKGGEFRLGLGVPLGVLFAGTGLLFFAPLVGLGPRLGGLRWAVDLLQRPFAEWDLLLDAHLHRFLPLANALPAMGLTALLFGVARVRGLLGGFALGSAALLTELAVRGAVATPVGPFFTRVWLVANALLCLAIARFTLDRK